MSTPSPFTRVTMCINNGSYGRQESHTLSAPLDHTDLSDIVRRLVAARVALLGNEHPSSDGVAANVKSKGTPQVEFIKCTDAVAPRLGLIISDKLKNNFGPQSSAAFPADHSSVAISLRMQGTLTQLSTGSGPSEPIMRGVTVQLTDGPDDLVQKGEYQGDTLMRNSSSYTNALKAYMDFLVAPVSLSGGGSAGWGFMGLSTAEEKFTISSFALVNNVWQLTIPGNSYETGDRVRITGAGTVFNGTWTVIKDPSTALVSLKRQPVSGHTVPRLGFAQRTGQADGARTLGFYDYTSYAKDGNGNPDATVSTKRPGREFKRISFRKVNRRER